MRQGITIVKKHYPVFHLKTNLKENHSKLNLQNLFEKYINYNFKLQFQTLQIQLKYINFFQNIFTSIQTQFITYTTYKPNIYNISSIHHKAINCHMLKLQRCNRMLMIHWSNLRTLLQCTWTLLYLQNAQNLRKKCQGVSWRLSKQIKPNINHASHNTVISIHNHCISYSFNITQHIPSSHYIHQS